MARDAHGGAPASAIARCERVPAREALCGGIPRPGKGGRGVLVLDLVELGGQRHQRSDERGRLHLLPRQRLHHCALKEYARFTKSSTGLIEDVLCEAW